MSTILKAFLTLVCCVFALQTASWLYHDAIGNYGLDFYEFWVGGDIVREGNRSGQHAALDLYSQQAFHEYGAKYLAAAHNAPPRQRKAAASWPVLETIASPFFFWTFGVLTTGNYERDFTGFVVVSLTSLILSIALLGWRLRYSLAGIAMAVALAAISTPVYSDLGVVNVNCPELLICVAYLLLRSASGTGILPVHFSRTRHAPANHPPKCRAEVLRSILPSPERKPDASEHLGMTDRPETTAAGEGKPAASRASRPCPREHRRDARDTRPLANVLAGGVLGILLALKPNLLLAPVLLIFSDLVGRRWREVIWQGVGFLITFPAAVAISSWKFGGVMCWFAWARDIRALTRVSSKPSRFGNFSLAQTIYEHTGKDLSAGLAIALVALAVAAIWWAGKRRSGKRPEMQSRDAELRHDLSLFGLAAGITFLASGLAWNHYCVLVIPFLLMLGSPFCRRDLAWKRMTCHTALCALIGLFLIPPPQQLIAILPFHPRDTTHIPLPCLQAAMMIIVAVAIWLELGVFSATSYGSASDTPGSRTPPPPSAPPST